MFLNPSRSFDANNRHVRFMGYDGMKSVPFAVEIAALQKAGLGMVRTEAQSLIAFDAMRASIHDVAREAYAGARQTSYLLKASDFH